jgi:hypothetical protein
MMDKLSNPVAFTSVPINEHDDPSPIINKKNHDAAIVIDEEEANRIQREMSHIIESFFGCASNEQEQVEEEEKQDKAYTQNDSNNPSLEFYR